MNDAFFSKHDKAIADLLQEINGFVFWQLSFGLEVLLEVRVANLLDDVVVVAAFHNVHNLYDILRF